MSFRLAPKSVTLNDLERRNGHVACVILPNSVAFFGLLCKSGWRYTDTFCERNAAQRI